MFVDFMDHPCPRIYIPTNLYTIIRLIFIKFIPFSLSTKLRPLEPGKCCLPTNINPTNKKDLEVNKCMISKYM